VLLHGPLVEGVEDGRFGCPARGHDVRGYRIERLAGVTGEEDACALPGELPGDRSSDRSSCSVDDGVLVLQQHLYPPRTRDFVYSVHKRRW
jgi:hypothetical protein